MPRSRAEIRAEIERFEPGDEGWLPLDSLVVELLENGATTEDADTLLKVFERFPEEDGDGVFWALVHGLEALPGYEPHVVAAVQRAPNEFNLLLVRRMLNSGKEVAAGTRLVSLLQAVAERTDLPDGVRREAAGHLQ